TPTAPQLAECGIVAGADLFSMDQTLVENIIIDPPAGVLPDTSPGPDGFPINFSPVGLPTGNILLNTFQSNAWQAAAGRCFSLLQPVTSYRVDIFCRSDQFYYQGSSLLTSVGADSATWGPVDVAPGVIVAALYPVA